MASKKEGIGVLQLNTQAGFSNKATGIAQWCLAHGVKVAALSETFLCEPDCKGRHRGKCRRYTSIQGWTFVGKPRAGREGGGVGFLIQDDVSFREREDLQVEGVEDVWVELINEGGGSFVLCSVYVPPSSPAQLCLFRESLQEVLRRHRRTIIMGDFNGRSFSLGDSGENQQGPLVVDLIEKCDLQLMNTNGVPTRKGSVLDLTLATPAAAQRISRWTVHDEFLSDHKGISLSIEFHAKADTAPPKVIWNFRRCNWARYQRELEMALAGWLEEVDLSGDIDTIYVSWVECIMLVARAVVPRRKVSSRSKPLASPELSRLSAERKKYVRMKRKSKTPEIRARINRKTAEIREELKRSRVKAIEEMCESLEAISPKDMWEKFQRITRTTVKPPTTLEHSGRTIVSNKDKAEILNRFFSETGEDTKDDAFDEKHAEETAKRVRSFDFRDGDICAENGRITEAEVQQEVRALRPNKASGIDGIHTRFLLHGGPVVVTTLTLLLNESWRRGDLYTLWRVAEISPVPKSAQANTADKFRPISLLSVVGKVMEGIVAARISARAEREHWFLDLQGGFRPGRGSVDQLNAFTHRVSQSFKGGQVCVTVFLDMSKAYDRVWREGLLDKLIKRGLKGEILRWVTAFLCNRSARVKFNGERSRMRHFPHGLPQGSRLSPILFNVFLADIFGPEVIDCDLDAGIYADDIRMSAYGKTAQEAADKLSRVLLNVANWAEKNRVRFDTESKKCGYMIFSKHEQPDGRVSFGLRILKRFRKPHRYLGVWFTENFSFAEHIKRVKGRAWRALHDVRRVVGKKSGATISVVLRLYFALVRPIIEYACSVWDCERIANKTCLDALQRAAMLSATGALHTTSTAALEVYCNVQSLGERRECFSALCMEKASRLDGTHPVAVLYSRWRERGSPPLPFSVFSRAAAACSIIGRFSSCQGWWRCVRRTDLNAPPTEKSNYEGQESTHEGGGSETTRGVAGSARK